MEKFIGNEFITIKDDTLEITKLKYYKDKILKYELNLYAANSPIDIKVVILRLIKETIFLCNDYKNKSITFSYYGQLSSEEDQKTLNKILDDIISVGRIIAILKS